MYLIYSKPESMSTLEAQLRAYSDLSEAHAQRLASETFNGGPRVPPPITPREDWPHLDEKEMRLVEYRIKRIERAINMAYPLLPDEILDAGGVFSSFLWTDYLDYPKGTDFWTPMFASVPEKTVQYMSLHIVGRPWEHWRNRTPA